LTVDIQPDEMSGEITSMTVAWTSLNVTTGSAGTKRVTSSNFTSPALLDSGTTITVVPDDIYIALYEYFQAESDGQGDAIVQCSLLDGSDGTLDFGFGGEGGPVVKVPFSELALPAIGTDGSWLTFQDGSLACVLGLEPTEDELPVILGDTFLRSAYVVYDLTNQQISLAQTVFNATDSNIVEISSTSPIASVVSGVTVTQTASNDPLGGATATSIATSIPTGSDSGTNSIGVLTSSTATATSASASTSQHGSAASIPAPIPGVMTSVLVAGASMLFGSAFFMLQ
jgi:Eukaryotic aspartyl protease